MVISLIVAHSYDWVIGKDNTLPWGKIKEDMAWFVRHTKGKTVLMGRKTYDSLNGYNLKDREMIVVSRSLEVDKEAKPDNLHICRSIEEGITLAKKFNKELMVIGGGEIYKAFIQHGFDRLYSTEILMQEPIVGTVYFPKVDLTNYNRSYYDIFISDKEDYTLTFSIYDKRKE